jgi:hypothetical protein
MPLKPYIQSWTGSGAGPTATVGAAVVTTAPTNATPYGYSQAQAQAILDNINALRNDVLALIAALQP